MQLSKFTSTNLDIVVLYRSQRGKFINLNENIELMKTEGKPYLITGDFNFSYLENPGNLTRKYLEIQKFNQLINQPTHIEGHILDQAYLKGTVVASAETHSKYYTDHKGLAMIIKNFKS